MLLKLRNLNREQVEKLKWFANNLANNDEIKSLLVSCDEFFRRMIKSESGEWEWKAEVFKVVSWKRSDYRRTIKDDDPNARFDVTLEVEEEFSLTIGGRGAGKYPTPRIIIIAIFDICKLFPTSLE